MKRNEKNFRWLLCLALGTANQLFAQSTATPPSSTVTKSAESETLVLNPFVVNSDRDEGFVAASALSGGRLASDLDTTPGAYSVQTREFLDALSLIDFSSAAEWTVNTGTSQDEGRNELFGNAVQVTIRGVGGNGVQRNFFPVNVNVDSYNVERFDYSRGPNAVLFGMGSFGGTPTVITKQARIGKKMFGNVSVGIGSWDRLRTSVDVNVSDGKRLALRVNGVVQDSKGWRDFEADDRKAVHLSGTFRPFKSTTLRGEFETGSLTKNNPVTGIVDRFLGWDGVTTVTGPMLTVPTNANALGIQRLGSNTAPQFVYSRNYSTTQIVNLANTARTLGGAQNPTTTIGGVAVVGPGPNIAGLPFNESLTLPDAVFERVINGTERRFQRPSRDFAVSTDEPTSIMDYRIYSGAWEQRIGQDFFIEAAGHYVDTEFNTNYLNQRGLADTYIDINRTLLDGSPNPNFLQPYNQGNRVKTRFDSEQYDARLAAAWIKRGTRFGDFGANVMTGKSWQNGATTLWNYVAHNGPEARNWTNTGQIAYRYYWNETSHPVPDIKSVAFLNPVTGITTEVPASFVLSTSRGLDSMKNERENTYYQAALKWDTFKNKLHLLAAARRDEVLISSSVGLANPRDYGASWDGQTAYRLPVAPGDYRSLTYRLKDASGVASGPELPADSRPRNASGDFLPQYANDRFRSDFSPPAVDATVDTYTLGGVYELTPWMSVIGNHATSFIPASGLQRFDGTLTPPRKSQGNDIGMRFKLFNGKVSTTITYYQGEETNATGDSPNAGPLNNIISANPIGDFTVGGVNIRNLALVPAVSQDTIDRENSGFEFDMVANLLRSWRVMANFALPKSYQTNVNPGIRAYMADNDAVLRQIMADAGVLISSSGVASIDTAVPIDDRSPDASSAAASWNALQTALANILTERQLLPRQNKLLANLFVDYTFREGFLKDFRLGGGFNYRGKQVIGFRGSDTIVDPSNPALAIDNPSVNALNAVWQDDYFLFTATMGYSRKLTKRLTLRVDLRIENLFDNTDPIYVNTTQRPPTGQLSSPVRVATPANFYYNTPRRYSLNTTLSF